MKKKISISLIIALLISLASLMPAKNSTAATGHMLFDKLDSVWVCVGSPVDCDF